MRHRMAADGVLPFSAAACPPIAAEDLQDRFRDLVSV